MNEVVLEDDGCCFVCGARNPAGLHLKFLFDGRKTSAPFTLLKTFQGYRDIIHGGIIAAILDEAMIKAALNQRIPAVTARIEVTFRNPLHCGQRATVDAEITQKDKKFIEAKAIIKQPDLTVIAEARAKLFAVSLVDKTPAI